METCTPPGSGYGNARLDPLPLTTTDMAIHLSSCLGMENPSDRAVQKPVWECWPFINHPELRAAVSLVGRHRPGWCLARTEAQTYAEYVGYFCQVHIYISSNFPWSFGSLVPGLSSAWSPIIHEPTCCGVFCFSFPAFRYSP